MNQPLSSNEQAKVFFFWLLLTLLIGAGGVGIFLILLTLWGLRMVRNTHDFSYLVTIRTIHKVCAGIAAIGVFLLSIVEWVDHGEINYDSVAFLLLSLLIYPVYPFLFDWLFYTPLCNRKEWIVTNGIFSTVERTNNPSNTAAFSFKKSSNLSVADELLKWNKLKEAGLVTEEEFAKARKDLLK